MIFKSDLVIPITDKKDPYMGLCYCHCNKDGIILQSIFFYGSSLSNCPIHIRADSTRLVSVVGVSTLIIPNTQMATSTKKTMIMISWTTALAIVPLKNAIKVAKATLNDSWNDFFCSISAINTKAKGIIITPKGGMTKLPTIKPMAAARFPHWVAPALSTKCWFAK